MARLARGRSPGVCRGTGRPPVPLGWPAWRAADLRLSANPIAFVTEALVVKRSYITVGMLAVTLLVPLAAASTRAMVKRLGGRTWQRLHRLVYVASGLGVSQSLWLPKRRVDAAYWYAIVPDALPGVLAAGWTRRRLARRPLTPPTPLALVR